MTMLTTDGATVTGAPQTTSGGIRRIPRERTATRATKKENTLQLPLGMALIVVVVAIGIVIAVSQKSLVLGINWYIGVLLGLALQRSRFCFTAAFRDPCLTGGTSLSKAVIVGLAAATAIFAALQLGAIVKTPDPAAALGAAMKIGGFEPVGIHTAVGAILFGLGAVIAGGCASGTLMRMGEGFAQQWIVIPFFVIGSAIGAASFPVWKEMLAVDAKRVVYLPQILGGFLPALVVQFAALFCVYLLASWWTRRKTGASQ